MRAIICTAVVSKHKQTSLHISRQLQALILFLYAGICHGDLYGHNIMCSRDGGVLLGDFGAATIYRSDTGTCMLSCSRDVSGCGREIEKIEVRALGILMLELLQCLEERSRDDIVQSLDQAILRVKVLYGQANPSPHTLRRVLCCGSLLFGAFAVYVAVVHVAS